MPSATSPLRPPISDSLISVVLPVYNEAGVLVELCQRLRAALTSCRTTFEIIFVNDGSSDSTPETLDRLARQFADVRVVHLSRNFGHQAAIHAGLSFARGDAIVLMDSDLQDSPEAIGKLLNAWQAGYDVVYAVRVGRKEAIWKRLLFAGFHRLLASISQTPMPLDAGNFGVIDARVAHTLVSLGEYDRYLPGLRSWVGFRQIGIPVERAARYDNQPRVSFRGLVRLAKTAIFSFSSVPLRAFAWIGWLALGAFFVVGGYSIYKILTEVSVAGWSSQALVICFFASLNALGISVLGEYIVRIYDQVRGRPMYLVDRTLNFVIEDSSHRVSRPTAAGQSLNLDELDPLSLESGWDDTYQHLLDQTSDLLELGALMRSEAEDLLERTRDSATEEDGFAPSSGESDGELAAEMGHGADEGENGRSEQPLVLKFTARPGVGKD
jgi:dolichol-phosphate mannosyltransferase